MVSKNLAFGVDSDKVVVLCDHLGSPKSTIEYR